MNPAISGLTVGRKVVTGFGWALIRFGCGRFCRAGRFHSVLLALVVTNTRVFLLSVLCSLVGLLRLLGGSSMHPFVGGFSAEVKELVAVRSRIRVRLGDTLSGRADECTHLFLHAIELGAYIGKSSHTSRMTFAYYFVSIKYRDLVAASINGVILNPAY